MVQKFVVPQPAPRLAARPLWAGPVQLRPCRRVSVSTNTTDWFCSWSRSWVRLGRNVIWCAALSGSFRAAAKIRGDDS